MEIQVARGCRKSAPLRRDVLNDNFGLVIILFKKKKKSASLERCIQTGMIRGNEKF